MSMDERSDVADKIDEVMLPGFRFHPTDEELVGFYLKRKIQQRPLSIELIRQLDIYKYDPWDLPKLATTGEKEWYFFCPRDRKYRNSARPNRVTEAGFWKATGTDRPIYSLEGSKCIGLKKSLVFYKGRAAKGIKTDWIMHEFRLPSLVDSVPTKRCIEKNNIPANDLWAICRISKKANSNAQRALSHSWVSPALPETSTTLDMLTPHFLGTSQVSSDTTRASLLIQYDSSSAKNDLLHSSIITSTTPNFDLPPFKPYNQMTTPYAFLSPETTNDNSTSNLLFNMSSSIFGDFDGIQDQYVNNGFSSNLLQVQENAGQGGEIVSLMKGHCPNVASLDDEYWGNLIRSTIGFPYSLPTSMPKSNLVCDSSSPCPSDQISTGYSTSKSNT